jgi:hypothetical protein
VDAALLGPGLRRDDVFGMGFANSTMDSRLRGNDVSVAETASAQWERFQRGGNRAGAGRHDACVRVLRSGSAK